MIFFFGGGEMYEETVDESAARLQHDPVPVPAA